MTEDSAKLCFVIMPFGERTDVAGKTVKFDDIYEHFIKQAITGAGLDSIRCDELEEAGFIHRKMIEHIWSANVAVVDISLQNPNVFYELGIRHTLHKSVTVLIRRKGTRAPFNIANLNVIEYDETDLASVARARDKIIESIRKGLQTRGNDSLVHEILDLRIGTVPKVLTRRKVYAYKLRQASDKSICIITGDIRNISGIDVWVNSENTNMQMARFYDWSISSMIRFLGAKRDVTGEVENDGDIIFKELNDIMHGKLSVAPGVVIPTNAGELEALGVKQVFHAAAVVGEIGAGYRPIENLAICVTNALKLADSRQFQDKHFRSILFPLFGAGTGRGDLRLSTRGLFESAVAYLMDNTSSAIERAYFLAWSVDELEMCQSLLQSFSELEAPVSS